VTVIGLTAIVITQGQAMFPFFVFFVLTGPIRYFIHFIQHGFRHDEKTANEKETEISSIDL
jgi:hypothetical protein